MSQLPLGVRLPDHADFDNFVPGENAAVVAAAMDLAASGAAPALWLWGPEASGKSHLLQAACAGAGSSAAAYLPLAQWLTAGPEVLTGWDERRLVCVDDIDAAAGKRDWEIALFNLFNALRDRGGSLLAAAQAAPRSCGFVLPDLVSRLQSGPVYRLRTLNEADRLSALVLRARRRGLEMPSETARWLARRYRRDMKSLFDLLETLDTASLAAKRRLTVPFVRGVLSTAHAADGKHQRAEQGE